MIDNSKNLPSADKLLLRIGLFGLGTIGTGFAEAILSNRRLAENLTIKKILVRDLTKTRSVLIPKEILTDDPYQIINDPDIDVIVELLGGEFPAVEYIAKALDSGKHVVTANKEVVAKHGAVLAERSFANGVSFLFEASVGGGMPIINPLVRDLAANEITSIKAIINGTTNYILTQMANYGSEFGSALSQAQKLGYAEPDPANDIEGTDATYKLAIMASLAFDGAVPVDAIYKEGITKLDSRDFRYARELGYAIKLLAIAKYVDGAAELRVHPTFIPDSHPLAKVEGVFNAVYIEGNLVGPLLLQGRGAGPNPTSSALIADILSIRAGTEGGTALGPILRSNTIGTRPMDQLMSGYYLRMQVLDEPGVLHQISSVFADLGISIASVIQKESDGSTGTAEIVVTTHRSLEADIQGGLQSLIALDSVSEIGACIRIDLHDAESSE